MLIAAKRCVAPHFQTYHRNTGFQYSKITVYLRNDPTYEAGLHFESKRVVIRPEYFCTIASLPFSNRRKMRGNSRLLRAQSSRGVLPCLDSRY